MSLDKFLGIEIGGTKLQLAVANSAGKIEQNIRYMVNSQGGASIIHDQIIEGLYELEKMDGIVAIGVGFGGPVDWKTGCIHVSHQVSGWERFNLAEWLKKLTKKPAVIENDANVAALAEAVHGSGKGFEKVFYMTIGSGIGGGLVENGNIYHGRTPGEVEIGHLKLNKKGFTLEAKCSGWAVNKRVRAFIMKNPHSFLARLAADSTVSEASLLKPAIENNDEDAKKMIEEIADDLAFALSHVVHLFHPEVIVIGGGLSLLKEHLRIPVSERLSFYIMKAFLPAPPVHIAALGENVVPTGAAELARKFWVNNRKH